MTKARMVERREAETAPANMKIDDEILDVWSEKTATGRLRQLI